MGSNATHMMGYDQLNNASVVKGDRHARSAQRVNKRNVSEAVSSLLTLGTIVCPSGQCTVDSDVRSHTNHSQSQSTICQTVVTEKVDTNSSDTAVQTVLSCDDIAGIESDNKARLLEPNSSLTVYSREWYEHRLDKVPFYTGVSSLVVLDIVFGQIEHYLSRVMKQNTSM